jgi:Asp-tRNA(Asn)/Glu-tRNA(Gln) amidotransferase A subunit family amidase
VGSPGRPLLDGASTELPAPRKPRRLIRLYTKGWEEIDAATREQFEALTARLSRSGIEIISRENDSNVAALEASFDDAFIARSLDITAYEMKWPYEQYVRQHGDRVVARIRDRIAKAATMTPACYASLLEEKAALRAKLRAIANGADGFLTLAASGPAPAGLESTGSRSFQLFATFLGVPAFSLPLMTVAGLPVGLQLIGREGQDGALCAVAHGLMREYSAK